MNEDDIRHDAAVLSGGGLILHSCLVEKPVKILRLDQLSAQSLLSIAERRKTGTPRSNAVSISYTRHDPVKVVCAVRNWHPVITKDLDVDQTGDLMVPVVGSCQGGFVPHFYSRLSQSTTSRK